MSTARVTTLSAIAALAIASTLASAQTSTSQTPPSTEAQRFKTQEKSMQQLSTPMPSASARVDRTQPPSDALPQARTRADRIERFRQLEDAMQRESSG